MKVELELEGVKSTAEFADTDCEISYTTKSSRKYSIRTFPSTAIDNRDARIYLLTIQSDNPSEKYNNYYVFSGSWLLSRNGWTWDELREIATLNTKIKLEKSEIKNNDYIYWAAPVGNNNSINEGIQDLIGKLREAQEKRIGF